MRSVARELQALLSPPDAPEPRDASLAGEPEWRVELERWLHTRRRGYAPVRERRAALWDAYRRAAARSADPGPPDAAPARS